MTEVEQNIVESWKHAAIELGFRFTSPAKIKISAGLEVEYPGLIHRFGRSGGTVIYALNEPSANLPRPGGAEYCASGLAKSYGRYNREYFIDTLDDWNFVGPAEEYPAWYTGKNWS